MARACLASATTHTTNHTTTKATPALVLALHEVVVSWDLDPAALDQPLLALACEPPRQHLQPVVAHGYERHLPLA